MSLLQGDEHNGPGNFFLDSRSTHSWSPEPPYKKADYPETTVLAWPWQMLQSTFLAEPNLWPALSTKYRSGVTILKVASPAPAIPAPVVQVITLMKPRREDPRHYIRAGITSLCLVQSLGIMRIPTKIDICYLCYYYDSFVLQYSPEHYNLVSHLIRCIKDCLTAFL